MLDLFIFISFVGEFVVCVVWVFWIYYEKEIFCFFYIDIIVLIILFVYKIKYINSKVFFKKILLKRK